MQPSQSARVEAVQPVAHRVAAQIHPGGDLLRLHAVHSMHDDLGTADERGSKRVGARDPLYLHPLMIIQLPYAKGHGPAPKPMAMSPQQRVDPAISTDLPDAPLRVRNRRAAPPRNTFRTEKRIEKRQPAALDW